MDSAHLLAVLIFVSYFLVILALFTLLLRSLPSRKSHHNGLAIYAFSFLTVASFAHTWFCKLLLTLRMPFNPNKSRERYVQVHALELHRIRDKSWIPTGHFPAVSHVRMAPEHCPV